MCSTWCLASKEASRGTSGALDPRPRSTRRLEPTPRRHVHYAKLLDTQHVMEQLGRTHESAYFSLIASYSLSLEKKEEKGGILCASVTWYVTFIHMCIQT